MHKCFGPCSGSCLQVQIYCSTILLPNTFTFISPDARSITLHKDDDTVQRQQFMLPLSQCTKLNHHHFLLLHDKGQKYCFDDKYFTDDHTSCAWSPSYETFTILRFITIKFETHLHPGWKTSWMLSLKSFHFISLKLLATRILSFFFSVYKPSATLFQSYPLHVQSHQVENRPFSMRVSKATVS